MGSIAFQQDGIPPRFAADVRLFLDKTFQEDELEEVAQFDRLLGRRT